MIVFHRGVTVIVLFLKRTNQDYFSFKTDTESKRTFEELKEASSGYVDFLNQQAKPLDLTYRYSSGNWQNVPWTTIYETDTGITSDDYVAVKYQDKTYLANYEKDIEWTRAKEIKQWENC